jgi:hypothetical protein
MKESRGALNVQKRGVLLEQRPGKSLASDLPLSYGSNTAERFSDERGTLTI